MEVEVWALWLAFAITRTRRQLDHFASAVFLEHRFPCFDRPQNPTLVTFARFEPNYTARRVADEDCKTVGCPGHDTEKPQRRPFHLRGRRREFRRVDRGGSNRPRTSRWQKNRTLPGRAQRPERDRP